MKKISPVDRAIKIILATVIILFFIGNMIIIAYSTTDENTSTKYEYSLKQMMIIGSYVTEDGSKGQITQQNYEVEPGHEYYRITGNFTQNVYNCKELIVYMPNLRVRLYIDGVLFFSYGDIGSFRSFSTSPGSRIGFYQINNVTTDTAVILEIEQPLYKAYPNGVNEFLTTMKLGYGDQVYRDFIEDKWPEIIISSLFVMSGTSLLFFSLVYTIVAKKNMFKLIAFAMFSVSGGLYVLADSLYHELPLIVTNQQWCNLIDTGAVPLTFISAALYLASVVKDKKIRNGILVVDIFVTIAGLVCQIQQFIQGVDFYISLSYIYAVGIVGVAYGLLSLIYVGFVKHEKESKIVLLLFLPLLIAAPLEIINSRVIEFMPTRVVGRYAICITILLQLVQLVHFIRIRSEEEAKVLQIEKVLIENRVKIMLSQIQPHFLYNALSVIQMLCREDPKKAEVALSKFGQFLRINMDSLTSVRLISFDKELEHVDNYLYLEKLRLNEKLNVVYELDYTDFFLPPLTLQPIVENAVKYGIGVKDEGGTVVISTKKDEENIYITVTDDGDGFDSSIVAFLPTRPDGRTHIGIKNVRDRIEEQCNGTLEIISKISQGTTIIVTIPR